MKNKIIEIIEIIESYSKNPITNILYEADFKKVADEILALLQREGWVKIRSADESCEHTTWYGKGSISVCADCHKTYEEVSPCYCEKCVGENDMSFEEDVPEDCDCKCCKPELWYLDKDRGYTWFKKSTLMQRTGDEVI